MEIGLKRAAVLCIIDDGNSFLLLKRGKEPHINKYIPIGGKIDPFETPDQAVVREVFEETGASTEPQLSGMLIETSPDKYNWINFIYYAKTKRFTPPICNEGVLEWIDYSELSKIITPEIDTYIYQYVIKREFFYLDAHYDKDINLIFLKEEPSGKVLNNKIKT